MGEPNWQWEITCRRRAVWARGFAYGPAGDDPLEADEVALAVLEEYAAGSRGDVRDLLAAAWLVDEPAMAGFAAGFALRAEHEIEQEVGAW